MSSKPTTPATSPPEGAPEFVPPRPGEARLAHPPATSSEALRGLVAVAHRIERLLWENLQETRALRIALEPSSKPSPSKTTRKTAKKKPAPKAREELETGKKTTPKP